MIAWLKHNWALVVLIIIAAKWLLGSISGTSRVSTSTIYSPEDGIADIQMAAPQSSKLLSFGRPNPVAPSESTNRLVIQDTSLSLQVKDVSVVIANIESTTRSLGGFLINSNLSKPSGAASGSISVRVPETKRSEALEEFKDMAVKVVSESVVGTDVTDQYTDLDAQLAVLLKTKTKFEEILDKAYSVNDLLNVQQQLINLQQQIDSVKGQQKYFEQSAKLSKIVVYLSTDELALPYAPTNEWRPAVVLKEAVRSLISNVRQIGSLLIWLIVYLPILIPVGLVIWLLRRRRLV